MNRPFIKDRLPLPDVPPGWDTIKDPRPTLLDKTYSFFDRDLASSAMQKSIRRCKFEEACQWALELAWMGPLSLSNMWSRLLIVALEDTSPSDYMTILQVYYLFQQDKNSNVNIITAVYILCHARRSRVNDWALHITKVSSDEADNIIRDEYGSIGKLAQEFKKALIGKDVVRCFELYEIAQQTTIQMTGKRYRKALYAFGLRP